MTESSNDPFDCIRQLPCYLLWIRCRKRDETHVALAGVLEESVGLSRDDALK